MARSPRCWRSGGLDPRGVAADLARPALAGRRLDLGGWLIATVTAIWH
jgi:hypothetical protein